MGLFDILYIACGCIDKNKKTIKLQFNYGNDQFLSCTICDIYRNKPL